MARKTPAKERRKDASEAVCPRVLHSKFLGNRLSVRHAILRLSAASKLLAWGTRSFAALDVILRKTRSDRALCREIGHSRQRPSRQCSTCMPAAGPAIAVRSKCACSSRILYSDHKLGLLERTFRKDFGNEHINGILIETPCGSKRQFE